MHNFVVSLALFIAATLHLPHLAWANDSPSKSKLIIGLVPNLSARTLITAFQPMKTYLEKQLNQPVEFYTAANFRAFHESTLRGEYDVVVTPAHFAWIAIKDAQYVPMMTYQTPLRGLVIVRQGSEIQSVRGLRGKQVGIIDPLAIVTLRGLEWFREQGLQPGTDFTVQKLGPHNTAALVVGSGKVDAAIIGSGPYQIMPENIRAQVKVFSEIGTVPNATYLANGNMPESKRKAVQQALLAFGNESPEGKQFMDHYKYGGFKPIGVNDLKAMEVYSRQVKALLAQSN